MQFFSIDDLNWVAPVHEPTRVAAKKCLERTDWQAVCRTASAARDGQPCKVLDKYTCGGSHLVRLLHFDDGNYCVARVQLREPTTESWRKLRTEVDTLRFLAAETSAPVPPVLALEGYAVSSSAYFVLLGFLAPGNTALDETMRYQRTDWDTIPPVHRPMFYRTLAAVHAQLASARLPQIGTVVRNPDGSFTVGPIPGLGGPFDDVESYLQAWAAAVRYPYTTDYLRACLPATVADEVITGTASLPGRLASLASVSSSSSNNSSSSKSKYFRDAGPFPIRHPDLSLNNLIVTSDFEVRGVIDWEDATTVPWTLVDAPVFLATVPRQLNPAERYDRTTGMPLDDDEVARWAGHQAYVDLVRDAETDAGTDHRLSDVLADRDLQDFAAVVHLFALGKMGFYGRAMDHFEAT